MGETTSKAQIDHRFEICDPRIPLASLMFASARGDIVSLKAVFASDRFQKGDFDHSRLFIQAFLAASEKGYTECRQAILASDRHSEISSGILVLGHCYWGVSACFRRLPQIIGVGILTCLALWGKQYAQKS